jgi:hypothetical protein
MAKRRDQGECLADWLHRRLNGRSAAPAHLDQEGGDLLNDASQRRPLGERTGTPVAAKTALTGFPRFEILSGAAFACVPRRGGIIIPEALASDSLGIPESLRC